VENRIYDLVDSSWFSPLAFVIRKSAIIILSDGKTIGSAVKVSRCAILAACHGGSTKFTQKGSTDENASPYCQVPTPRNVEIDDRSNEIHQLVNTKKKTTLCSCHRVEGREIGEKKLKSMNKKFIL
jgi:hypothetical protein